MFSDYLTWTNFLGLICGLAVILVSAFIYQHIDHPKMLWVLYLFVIGLLACVTKESVAYLERRRQSNATVDRGIPPAVIPSQRPAQETTHPSSHPATTQADSPTAKPLFRATALTRIVSAPWLTPNSIALKQNTPEGPIIFPIESFYYIQLTNVSDAPFFVGEYGLAYEAPDGTRAPLGLMQIQFGELLWFLSGKPKGLSIADAYFAAAVRGKAISPGETVSGWIAFNTDARDDRLNPNLIFLLRTSLGKEGNERMQFKNSSEDKLESANVVAGLQTLDWVDVGQIPVKEWTSLTDSAQLRNTAFAVDAPISASTKSVKTASFYAKYTWRLGAPVGSPTGPAGAWYLRANLTPIRVACLLEFTNLRSSSVMIASYHVMSRGDDSRWTPSDMIEAGQTKGGRFFLGPQQAARNATYVTFDSAIEGQNIAPNATVRGWIFFRRPPGADLQLNILYTDETKASGPLFLPHQQQSQDDDLYVSAPVQSDLSEFGDEIEDLSGMKINEDGPIGFLEAFLVDDPASKNRADAMDAKNDFAQVPRKIEDRRIRSLLKHSFPVGYPKAVQVCCNPGDEESDSLSRQIIAFLKSRDLRVDDVPSKSLAPLLQPGITFRDLGPDKVAILVGSKPALI